MLEFFSKRSQQPKTPSEAEIRALIVSEVSRSLSEVEKRRLATYVHADAVSSLRAFWDYAQKEKIALRDVAQVLKTCEVEFAGRIYRLEAVIYVTEKGSGVGIRASVRMPVRIERRRREEFEQALEDVWMPIKDFPLVAGASADDALKEALRLLQSYAPRFT
jgi:hypothetical protein